jgi:aspartate-alanine antiporter
MIWLHNLFASSPECALFLTLAIGYAVGKITIKRFQFGGIAGALIVAVIVSQVGVHIDDSVKNVMFALFIYAVGFDCGPQFFNSLNKSALKEIAMSVFLAACALITVLACARFFNFDKGLAAGIAGGGVTQSAIIGTAGDAIARLGLSAAETARLQSNVAVGYAVTYVFGSLGAILICVGIIPKFMGAALKDDAEKVETTLRGDTHEYKAGESPAVQSIVGRIFKVHQASGQSVRQIEISLGDVVTIERVKHNGKAADPKPNQILQEGDLVLLVGRGEAMLNADSKIGNETANTEGFSLTMQSRQAVLTHKNLHQSTIAEIRDYVGRNMRHGVYIQSAFRMGNAVLIASQTRLERGDVVTFYGTPLDTKRAANAAGYEIVQDGKADFIYLGLGIVVGLLLGQLNARIAGVSLTLGSGGGVLLSGLVFGWMRSKEPIFGALPAPASQLLRDFGLAAFVTVVGLNSGLTAFNTLKERGISIFLAGVIVTVVPLIATMLFGRYVLRYKNSAILAGALAGSRSANPAFGEVLASAGNTVPTVPFAITYAIANVLLTLLGPLIVGLV